MGYSISLVIPAYNESDNIATTIRQADDVISGLADRWEIIVVDDGSVDQTGHTVESLFSQYPGLRLVSHPANRGYGAALRTGFSNARYDYILLYPADGQFELSQIPQFLKEIENVDIVAGYRRHRKDNILRRINGLIFNLAVRIFFGLHFKDIDCGYKLYRNCIFNSIELSCNGALIDTELFYKAKRKNFTVREIEVIHKPRVYGYSTGASPRVISYAMGEFINLWIRLCIFNR